MNIEEFNALSQLLSRIPLSGAEAIWVNSFLTRQRMEIAKAEEEAKRAAEKQKAEP